MSHKQQQHDPRSVLRLPKDFTLDQLKMNYRRLALQLHPDKNLVNPESAAEIFNLLTESYDTLLQEYHLKKNDKQFKELKEGYLASSDRSEQRQHSKVHPKSHGEDKTKKAAEAYFKGYDGGFDPEKFNTFFSEHRMKDPNDSGYGEWLRQDNVDYRPRPSKEVPKVCKDLLLHVDTLALGRSKLGFSEMGYDEIDDFSIANKGVEATDLRMAYNNNSYLDEATSSSQSRKTYRNIEELERDRGNLAYTLNDEGKDAVETYKNWTASIEKTQQEKIRDADKNSQLHFGKIRHLLVGVNQ